MAKISQPTIVHNHLMKYGSITSIEAFSKYKITRLSAAVFTLRHKKQIPILSIDEKSVDEDGSIHPYVRYTLNDNRNATYINQ